MYGVVVVGGSRYGAVELHRTDWLAPVTTPRQASSVINWPRVYLEPGTGVWSTMGIVRPLPSSFSSVGVAATTAPSSETIRATSFILSGILRSESCTGKERNRKSENLVSGLISANKNKCYFGDARLRRLRSKIWACLYTSFYQRGASSPPLGAMSHTCLGSQYPFLSQTRYRPCSLQQLHYFYQEYWPECRTLVFTAITGSCRAEVEKSRSQTNTAEALLPPIASNQARGD